MRMLNSRLTFLGALSSLVFFLMYSRNSKENIETIIIEEKFDLKTYQLEKKEIEMIYKNLNRTSPNENFELIRQKFIKKRLQKRISC